VSTPASIVSFDVVVEAAVKEAVTRTLGEDVWKAIGFYFDPKQAASNPEAFSSILDKMFGSSSRVLQKVVTETLLKKVGSAMVVDRQGRSFYDWIQIAKAKFSSNLNALVRPVN
jgi:hypothetical protein